jgi:squalene-hopene/tetraprenyl-beta-curcumene cyclase
VNPGGWNAGSAAAYLDARATWWSHWPVAARDHGTFCISCHTALPYALARPVLQKALNQSAPATQDTVLLNNVIRRVELSTQSEPYYPDSVGPGKTVQSRGTESVLNALILVSADAGAGKMSDVSQKALRTMWATQASTGEERGAWPWLDFGNQPFEAKGAAYYGAALAAVAVGLAPSEYRSRPELRGHLQWLREYLDAQSSRAPLIHRAVTLWAATRWPDLLPPSERKAILDDIFHSENADGGWGLSSTGWTWRGMNPHSVLTLWVRSDDSPLRRKSDGCATGLIVFVLRQAGLPVTESHVRNGRSWLLANQDRAGGEWPGYSMMNRRALSSETGRFMTDAATAYAVLALAATDEH